LHPGVIRDRENRCREHRVISTGGLFGGKRILGVLWGQGPMHRQGVKKVSEIKPIPFTKRQLRRTVTGI